MHHATRPKWVVFGDSITQKGNDPANEGWVSRLQDTYQRRVDILNRGYSGYNSRWAKMIWPHIEPTFRGAELVTVWFGANDAALPDRTSKVQHVPLEEYRANLKYIVDRLKSLACEVILVTPPPVSEPHRIRHAKEMYGVDLDLGSERTNEVTKEYAQACLDVAHACSVHVVDMWQICMQREPMRYGDVFLNDGLHLAAPGNGVMFESLISLLNDSLPQFCVQEIPTDIPEYRELIMGGDDEEKARAMLEKFLSAGRSTQT